MALNFQTVPITFSGGIDTKTDSKEVIPTKLTTLENGLFTKGKTIIKRNGYDSLATGILGGAGAIGPSDALGVFKPHAGDEEIVQFGNNHIYSYSSTTSKWIDKGEIYSVREKLKQVIRNNYQQNNPDFALVNGIEIHVYGDTRGGVRVTVLDNATGTQYLSDVSMNTTAYVFPRVVGIGTKAFIFYQNGTGIYYRIIDTSTPNVLGVETLLVNDATVVAPKFDTTLNGANIVLAYNTGAAINVKNIDNTGAIVNSTVIPEVPDNCLSVVANTDVFVYWHSNAAGTRYSVFSNVLGLVLAATTIDGTLVPITDRITAYPTSTTQQTVFYEVDAAITYNHFIKTAVVNTVGVVTPASVLLRSVGIASKPFVINSEIFLNVVFDSPLQSTFFLMRSDGKVIAKMLQGRAGGLPLNQSLATPVVLNSTNVLFPASIKIKLISESGNVLGINGVSAIQFDFHPVTRFDNSILGENLHITGGFINMYDGAGVVEHGFHIYPEGITDVVALAGGGIRDGVFEYFVIYEWVDNNGQVHRSSPSVGLSVTIAGGGGAAEVTLTIPTLRITDKKPPNRTPVTIAIYRTTANGVVAHRITSFLLPPLANDTTVDTVTYLDQADDPSIVGNEILYTSGGVLENIEAPGCAFMDVYQNRMVVSGLEDPLEVWYSKVKVKGEGVAFNDSFLFRVDPLGGDVSAVKLMDDKILIFKENNIFYVSGDGPVDTGQQNNYSIPQLITSDVGCPYQDSLVLTPLGVMFKSNKGIYIVTRALDVKYLGVDVEFYNNQNVTAATLILNKNQVRFLTDSGLTLMYDYYFGQWSTFTNHQGQDSVNWMGVYSYLRNNGTVYKESSSNYQDVSSNVVLRVATAWMKMAGIQGFQRVQRCGFLGNYVSAHQLQIDVGYDYNNSYTDTETFDATTNIGVPNLPYEFRKQLKIQKCAAVRFQFQDVGVTLNASYELTDLSLQVGLKPGINRLRSAQSI